ncbi:hypothetical protein IMG5_115330 [Ichthyophthirius multifiliis]|uniref:Transmembrane protein n=1 Tax=Ichthyophthirius multifiliis TaxID=5932 RepID=G0QU72_ICHMU|nr:hypothetical protein IMG5_115330 [Ichthyophthirius multifiliis]EGR31230.1 hypothetical protein IMG5_115330 [Ichthyophthirius multifiliis]|eukprot:XP_004034716.1 hypothetical protein IMG5_115330 [Ichthyophthirius multifiliis]
MKIILNIYYYYFRYQFQYFLLVYYLDLQALFHLFLELIQWLFLYVSHHQQQAIVQKTQKNSIKVLQNLYNQLKQNFQFVKQFKIKTKSINIGDYNLDNIFSYNYVSLVIEGVPASLIV